MKLKKRIMCGILSIAVTASACISGTFTAFAEETENDYLLSEKKTVMYVTGTDLQKAGLDVDSIISKDPKATYYVHLTKTNKYSYLRASAGDTVAGSSNKALVAYASTQSNDTKHYIQNPDTQNGVGEAGTANYSFPECNTNKATSAETLYFRIQIWTKDTEAEPLGIVFSDKQSVTINPDGTLTKGFTVPKLESNELVDPNRDPDVDGEVWEQSVTKRKANLKLTLDYVKTMDKSKYTAESWADFEAAIPAAQAEYDNSSATADSLKKARDTLEKAKSKLIFATEPEESNPMPFRELNAAQTVKEMGVGTNLGNTMDGHSNFTPSETSWQSAVTTKAYIKALHDAGYNTLRIPVTWGNMIDDDNGYALKENWLNRVQEIVDYCIDQDMYAIINVHHDGAEQLSWLRVAADDIDSVMEKFEGVWRNIAERFKDYDEHLIFESMNEITSGKTEGTKNSSQAVTYDTPIIVNFNQLFVNTVRSTGSNNEKRWLAAVAHYANNGTSKDFVMPEDTYNESNRLMFALHIYSDVNGVLDRLKGAYNKFGNKDIPMYLGEYGRTLAKDANTDSGYNDPFRANYSEIVNRACQVYGICPVVWDQGFGNNGEYETGLYSYWNRAELRPIFKSITDALARGTLLEPSDKNKNGDFSDIYEGTKNAGIVNEFDSVDSEKTVVDMTVGDWTEIKAEGIVEENTPDYNVSDVLVWSTDNDDVATVFNGKIHATGIGETTIHASALSGSAKADIKVNVKAVVSDKKAVITTDSEEYSLVKDLSVQISASTDNGERVTYKSSNPDIATVNSQGRVFGISFGTAYVVITSESGATKTVKVIVTDALTTNEITLGLKVLYNDSTHNYYSAETGDLITVSEEGTYTLKFDIDKNLSSAGKTAGITDISNLTAIYIQDQTYALGDAKSSPLETCDIKYTSVKLNGKELTLLPDKAGPKTAIKSGIFDTGDPVNAWDGSAVDESQLVWDQSNHVVSFKESTPKTFEVTFTLSNMKFKTASPTRATEITRIKEASETVINGSVGDTVNVKVSVRPITTDMMTTFISSDESVAIVENGAFSPDKDGYITVPVKIVGKGTATVKAITENGLEVVFTVNSGVNTLTGNIITPGGNSAPVTVEITKDGETEPILTVASTDSMTYEAALAPGSYTVKFIKEGFVTRTYSVSISDKNETLDAEIHLIGDVNGDGKRTTVDVGIVNSCVKKSSELTGYDLEVANANNDKIISTVDVGMINRIAKGLA